MCIFCLTHLNPLPMESLSVINDALAESLMTAPLSASHEYAAAPRRVRKPKEIQKTVRIGKAVFLLDWEIANLEFRRSYLKAALDLHGGNIQQTARALGIVRRTLQIQMIALGLREKRPEKSRGPHSGAKSHSQDLMLRECK